MVTEYISGVFSRLLHGIRVDYNCCTMLDIFGVYLCLNSLSDSLTGLHLLCFLFFPCQNLSEILPRQEMVVSSIAGTSFPFWV